MTAVVSVVMDRKSERQSRSRWGPDTAKSKAASSRWGPDRSRGASLPEKAVKQDAAEASKTPASAPRKRSRWLPQQQSGQKSEEKKENGLETNREPNGQPVLLNKADEGPNEPEETSIAVHSKAESTELTNPEPPLEESIQAEAKSAADGAQLADAAVSLVDYDEQETEAVDYFGIAPKLETARVEEVLKTIPDPGNKSEPAAVQSINSQHTYQESQEVVSTIPVTTDKTEIEGTVKELADAQVTDQQGADKSEEQTEGLMEREYGDFVDELNSDFPEAREAAAPAAPAEASKFDPSDLYVGSVPRDIDEVALGSLFARAGLVKSAYLVPDEAQPGQHKGYGFVRMADAAAVPDAVRQLNGYQVAGSRLVVRPQGPAGQQESSDESASTAAATAPDQNGQPAAESEATASDAAAAYYGYEAYSAYYNLGYSSYGTGMHPGYSAPDAAASSAAVPTETAAGATGVEGYPPSSSQMYYGYGYDAYAAHPSAADQAVAAMATPAGETHDASTAQQTAAVDMQQLQQMYPYGYYHYSGYQYPPYGAAMYGQPAAGYYGGYAASAAAEPGVQAVASDGQPAPEAAAAAGQPGSGEQLAGSDEKKVRGKKPGQPKEREVLQITLQDYPPKPAAEKKESAVPMASSQPQLQAQPADPQASQPEPQQQPAERTPPTENAAPEAESAGPAPEPAAEAPKSPAKAAEPAGPSPAPASGSSAQSKGRVRRSRWKQQQGTPEALQLGEPHEGKQEQPAAGKEPAAELQAQPVQEDAQPAKPAGTPAAKPASTPATMDMEEGEIPEDSAVPASSPDSLRQKRTRSRSRSGSPGADRRDQHSKRPSGPQRRSPSYGAEPSHSTMPEPRRSGSGISAGGKKPAPVSKAAREYGSRAPLARGAGPLGSGGGSGGIGRPSSSGVQSPSDSIGFSRPYVDEYEGYPPGEFGDERAWGPGVYPAAFVPIPAVVAVSDVAPMWGVPGPAFGMPYRPKQVMGPGAAYGNRGGMNGSHSGGGAGGAASLRPMGGPRSGGALPGSGAAKGPFKRPSSASMS